MLRQLYKVTSNVCVPCPAGSTNAAGDVASGSDTFCDATICIRDQRVLENACVYCGARFENDFGDDAGTDTSCTLISIPPSREQVALLAVAAVIGSDENLIPADQLTNEAVQLLAENGIRFVSPVLDAKILGALKSGDIGTAKAALANVNTLVALEIITDLIIAALVDPEQSTILDRLQSIKEDLELKAEQEEGGETGSNRINIPSSETTLQIAAKAGDTRIAVGWDFQNVVEVGDMVTIGAGSDESETVVVTGAVAKFSYITFTPSLKFAHGSETTINVKVVEVDTPAGQPATGAPTAPPPSVTPLQTTAESKAPAEVAEVFSDNIANTHANDVTVTPMEIDVVTPMEVHVDVVTPMEADVVTPMKVVDTPARIVDVESSGKLGAAEPKDSAKPGHAKSKEQNGAERTGKGGHATKSAAYAAFSATAAKSKVSVATVVSIIVSAVALVALFAHTWQSGNSVVQTKTEFAPLLMP
jgi:hypothetical protein